MRTAVQHVVAVAGCDPVSRAGLAAQLRARPGLRLAERVDEEVEVIVLALTGTDDELVELRRLARSRGVRVVVIVEDLDEHAVLRLVEAGASGVVRRSEASPEHLEEVVARAARGDGALPADLLGGLFRQVKRLQEDVLTPRGLTMSGLSPREASVLSLVADGFDTRTIADKLCYSERTIKNIIQDVMRRFGLRNRSHAVAFALREGFI